eukprot:CAMPEP_0117576064 /NCGR_PEP_ID=MMETSP0784-20121206/62580_1 /TAXON_ID=39447 /ORGANISM="" /LENGTH=333 /DNA_ID=CAMNT_0005375255 /DNA_START=44 /DNA_END=1042 /DNA_ORIENTATION=+
MTYAFEARRSCIRVGCDVRRWPVRRLLLSIRLQGLLSCGLFAACASLLPVPQALVRWPGALVGGASVGVATGVHCRRVVALRAWRKRQRFAVEMREDWGHFQRVRPVPRHSRECLFSVDVECVAVGRTHERRSRAPVSVALVDGIGKLLYESLILPEQPIVSYLTPFTGLRDGDLERRGALPLSQVVQALRRILPRSAVLVGQCPQGDIEWLGLKKGVDFADTVDLAEVFRGSRGVACSLRHEAFVLLGKTPPPGHHDPRWDAAVSMELYHKAVVAGTSQLRAMQERLTSGRFWPPRPSTARRLGYRLDGVCLSMYSSANCMCGQPSENTFGW